VAHFDYEVITGPTQDYRFVADRYRKLMPGEFAERRHPFQYFTGAHFDYDVIAGPTQDYRFVTDRYRKLDSVGAQLQVAAAEHLHKVSSVFDQLGEPRQFSVGYFGGSLVATFL
jgi:hypothetical protein